jgi:hypothetical protein
MDQPRVNMLLRRQPKGAPLSTTAAGQTTFNIESFLDTGAGSLLLSTGTTSQLGVTREIIPASKSEARFTDIGVGGESQFAISEPLYLAIAPCTPTVDIDNKDTIDTVYNQTAGPIRAEVGPLGLMNGLLSALAGDTDVTGMPAMQGKVVVMDARDVNNLTDKIRTYLYDAKSRNTANPPIPQTTRHVRLSFANFAQYTTTNPPTAESPAIAANPIIGPNPLKPAGDTTPPIQLFHQNKSAKGSWLLDTGAVASMISIHQAEALGVTYAPNPLGINDPQLLGVPADQQFTLSVGGIGGMAHSAGFYIDKLVLTTREGKPITYLHAPVLVADITARDPATGQSITLDGVFGMNFLVASAKVDGGLLPDISHITAGPFKWIVFDQPAGLLGFD